jgi:hypothetical protein
MPAKLPHMTAKANFSGSPKAAARETALEAGMGPIFPTLFNTKVASVPVHTETAVGPYWSTRDVRCSRGTGEGASTLSSITKDEFSSGVEWGRDSTTTVAGKAGPVRTGLLLAVGKSASEGRGNHATEDDSKSARETNASEFLTVSIRTIIMLSSVPILGETVVARWRRYVWIVDCETKNK